MTIVPETPPLREEPAGVLRVGNSRVLFEIVIEEFLDGSTPETIVRRYPTVTLADVYGTIAFYLRHKPEMDAYLADIERQASEIEREVEQRNSQNPKLVELRKRIESERFAQHPK